MTYRDVEHLFRCTLGIPICSLVKMFLQLACSFSFKSSVYSLDNQCFLIKYVFFKYSLPVIGLSSSFDIVFHRVQVFNIKKVHHENDLFHRLCFGVVSKKSPTHGRSSKFSPKLSSRVFVIFVPTV